MKIFQYLLSKPGLQGSKPENFIPVPLQYELHTPFTKVADSVEKNYRVIVQDFIHCKIKNRPGPVLFIKTADYYPIL